MDLSRLLPAALLAVALFAYLLGLSWATRRLWRSGRVSTRTLVLINSGRLAIPMMVGGPLAVVLGAPPLTAVLLPVLGAMLWAATYRTTLHLVPDLEAQRASLSDQVGGLDGLSGVEKGAVLFFLGLTFIAGFAAVVLMFSLSSKG